MTPLDALKMQALRQTGSDVLMKALPYAGAAAGVGALYGANTLLGGEDERWDRTAINTGGNLAGAALGYRTLGIPGAVVGGLLGGVASDAIANQFDDADGRASAGTVNATDLLNTHLATMNPYEKEAVLRQQLQQAQLQQRDQQRAMREAAMQQYQ